MLEKSTMNKFIIILILGIFSVLFYSCNIMQDRDKWCDTKNQEFEICCRFDTMQFRYFSKIYCRADREITLPIHFTTNLPKGLKKLAYYSSSEFYFLYPGKQLIFISLDLSSKHKLNDTTYIPTLVEMEDMFLNSCEIGPDLAKDGLKQGKNRTSLIIQKNNAKILLFNIKEENLPCFRETLKSFVTQKQK